MRRSAASGRGAGAPDSGRREGRRPQGPEAPKRGSRSQGAKLAAVFIAMAAAVALILIATRAVPSAPGHGAIPAKAESYLGVYLPGVPPSYSPVQAFAEGTGVRPNLVVYYSSWWQSLDANFIAAAAKHDAVPIVQIDPAGVSLAAIAAGRYDSYLVKYAAAVRAYRSPLILCLGHEMNGWWYSWGYRHTSPVVFVAAWRHIVTLFRDLGARNVTWLWTINVIDAHAKILPPAPWWPGSKYVNWVGIDGYYRNSSERFAALFGPTIKAVRALTRDPILIAETGAPNATGQPAKITDLFAGIRAYGLLGLVWFDAKDWTMESQAAITAFRNAAKAYGKTAG